MTADEAQRTTLEKVRVLQRKLYRAAKLSRSERSEFCLIRSAVWRCYGLHGRKFGVTAERRASMAKPSNRSRRGERCGFFWNCGRN